MKKSQRLKVLVFLGNFFIRYIFLLLGGLGALALMRNSAGMIIGSMLISLDLLLSVYWSFYLPAKFKKEGNTMFSDFDEALDTEGDLEGWLDKWAERPGDDRGRLIYEQSLDTDEASLEDCLDGFKQSCADQNYEGEDKYFLDTGIVEYPANTFEFKLRKRILNEKGTIVDLYLALQCEADEQSGSYTECIMSSEIETDFFEYVRNSEVGKYMSEKKYTSLKVGSRAF